MVAAVVFARHRGLPASRSLERYLSSRSAVVVVSALTSLVVWFVWGSMRAPPVIHDEAAYLFQAKLFARGHWAAPTPALPEFFEQFHVMIVPTWASKYPPGHSLLLSPGVALGLPGLIPLTLSGVTGGLVFVLARRLSGVWVALLTWVFWATAWGNLHYRPTYFSEVTTSALLLGAWLALLRWRDSGRPHWLAATAIFIAWTAITRPLTALAVGLPVVPLVLLIARKQRDWRQVVVAGVLGVLIVGVIPMWSAETTGDWTETPQVLYAKTYLPFDLPGFGNVTTVGQRRGPPELPQFDAFYRSIRSAHTVKGLPTTLVDRLGGIAFDMWGGWRAALLPFFFVGLFFISAEAWFAVASSALVVAAYLTYHHHPFHTRYYLELAPVLAFVCMAGFMATVRKLTDETADSSGSRSGVERSATVALFACILAWWPAWFSIRRARILEQGHMTPVSRFLASMNTISDDKAMVFLRYGEHPDIYRSLMSNDPNLESARLWIVYDRGTANATIMRLAPDRKPYAYDVEAGVLTPGAP
ncbi:MAG: hypothetical protein H0T50_10515 [Gemmatimonadales bacterium]|nr:hypothetical protein [Gemmatimonadales bacterium]